MLLKAQQEMEAEEAKLTSDDQETTQEPDEATEELPTKDGPASGDEKELAEKQAKEA